MDPISTNPEVVESTESLETVEQKNNSIYKNNLIKQVEQGDKVLTLLDCHHH